jgi:phytoene dehydrogenase-like protein
MHGVISSRFKSPKLVQLFDRYATYNGSSPYRAPGTLNVIAHLEHNMGAFFPEGGMRDIINALEKLAVRCSVSLHNGSEVRSVVRDGSRITGIVTDAGFIPASVVISAVDVITFYRKLLKEEKPPADRKGRREAICTDLLLGQ